MGSWLSKQTNDDWNDAFNQAEQHNRRVQERGDELPVFNGEATGRNVKLKEKPLHKMIINYFIDEHLEWEPSKQVVNQFDYKMTVKSIAPGTFHARVHLWAKVLVNSDSLFEKIDSAVPPLDFVINSQEKKIEFSINMDQKIPSSFRDGKEIHPLVVELFDEQTKVLNFFNLERREGFKPLLTHRALVFGKMYTELENVYGLRTSSLVNKQNSEKCAICMDNEIDTIVKPCNHMCMCHDCAQQLKMQTKLCPICRNVFSSFSKIIVKE